MIYWFNNLLIHSLTSYYWFIHYLHFATLPVFIILHFKFCSKSGLPLLNWASYCNAIVKKPSLTGLHWASYCWKPRLTYLASRYSQKQYRHCYPRFFQKFVSFKHSSSLRLTMTLLFLRMPRDNLQLPGLLTIGSPEKPSRTGLLNNSITIGSPV